MPTRVAEQREPASAPVGRPLLVVDGDSILFRAFYALPEGLEGSDGQPINALLGGANLILREVEAHRPRAVVVCFGSEAAAYRVELYPEYHAQRDELPQRLAPQFADAGEFFRAFGWTVASHDSLEADDLLGSFAAREAAAGGHALVMTGDRDLFQCASERVTVLYVRTGREGGEEVDPDEVRRRYGVSPELVPDFIALRGDPSDGIPGARGIGPKTAAELLARHGSLDAVLAGAVRESRPSVRAALLQAREQLLMFRRLATLENIDVTIPPDRTTDWTEAAAAARTRGMARLAERLERLALRPAS